MTENIQSKIDHIMQLAATSIKASDFKHDDSISRVNNDSLSMSIRNEAEANLFLAELDAIVKAEQRM